jgi:hypothetical protein
LALSASSAITVTAIRKTSTGAIRATKFTTSEVTV